MDSHGGDPQNEAGLVQQQHPGMPCRRREKERDPRGENDQCQRHQHRAEQAKRHGWRSLVPIFGGAEAVATELTCGAAYLEPCRRTSNLPMKTWGESTERTRRILPPSAASSTKSTTATDAVS